MVAIGLFAGLRPNSELVTRKWEPVLFWSDIDWERLEIHVAAHRTKTARHRVVPMEPCLVAWLDSVNARDLTGPVAIPGARKRLEAARARAGIEWAPDILRHTYATMWLAKFQDKARLAEQMGNSPAIIDQHYRFPLSQRIAADFWNLWPAVEDAPPQALMACPWPAPNAKIPRAARKQPA